MDDDPLAERLVDRLCQGAVKIGFPAEDEGKAVQGVIAVVHDQLQVVQDGRGEVLAFVDGKAEGAFFLMVKIVYLLLHGLEHLGLGAGRLQAEDGTQKIIELSYADGGEADILHMAKVLVHAFCKTAQAEGLAHAGLCGKDADAPDIPHIGEAGGHLLKIVGVKTVLLFLALLVKRIEGKAVIIREHQFPPPIFV